MKDFATTKAQTSTLLAAAQRVHFPLADGQDDNGLPPPDRSRAGYIDRDILPFITLLNTITVFTPISSCSGRLIVTGIPRSGQAAGRAYERLRFLRVTHTIDDTATGIDQETAQVAQTVQNSLVDCTDLWFKAEAVIVAVLCASQADAERLVAVAKGAGLKRCSFARAGKGSHYFHVLLCDTLRVEAPLPIDGAGDDGGPYLRTLVARGTAKVLESRRRFDRLADAIATSFKDQLEEPTGQQ
mmetsp:Transcript_13980/g.44012  ORF Transcript_13980/g.44012 Transcript_13980/m.44012 type:complete len:242 (-) Transcript_13980:729-1454(-)